MRQNSRCPASPVPAGTIDRQALVTRHNVRLSRPDPLSPLSVGNGEFAFTADVTGLQSFPDFHAPGIPLATQSHWGWHSLPNPQGYSAADFPLTDYDSHGRKVGYLFSGVKGREEEVAWLRANPHRLNLGQIGLELKKADGSPVVIEGVEQIRQNLDLWRGLLTSQFTVEGQPVCVQTCCHPALDAIAVRIDSPLIAAGRLRVRLAFSYPSGAWGPGLDEWNQPDAHQTILCRRGADRVDFTRRLDAEAYQVGLAWGPEAVLSREGPHQFFLAGGQGSRTLEFVCAFAPDALPVSLPDVRQTQAAAAAHWERFWRTGGAVDLAESKDPRWEELERRVILSQYLTAIQCAGSLPPQETGLTCNSWFGKFHLEMHWWHAAHFGLWGRIEMLERSLPFYQRLLPKGQATAWRQGYAGVRWPKCMGPEGDQRPCSIEPFLVWQQPHPIYYAEICYRAHPDRQTLEEYREIVFQTAQFLASFPYLDEQRDQYVLGPPLGVVSENLDAATTVNGMFELSYWRFGLRVAQLWRERLGLPRDPRWDDVLCRLSPLPVDDGLYLTSEGRTDTYSKYNWEHPALTGPYGVLPGDGADKETMRRTLRRVLACWKWDRCWGWDFPMLAMCAARVGEPSLAVDALLLPTPKNTYLPNGHNYQNQRLPLYLPGNGGLLSAVAMMAAGWDGAPDMPAPGFPADGSWHVRWEGLQPLP